MNSPAIIAAAIQSRLTKFIFSDLCVYTQIKFQILFLIFFVTLQWLFIGWAAKTIAQKIRFTGFCHYIFQFAELDDYGLSRRNSP